jgi:peptidase YpeB-like protein
MRSRIFSAFIAAVSLALGACQSDSAAGTAGTMVYDPPSQAFAQGLGITGGPVSSDQAKLIAAAAAGGTALGVEQEDEDGVRVFGVKVQTAAGNKDVKVRISDGAVTKIEPDDGAETPGGEAESPDSPED